PIVALLFAFLVAYFSFSLRGLKVDASHAGRLRDELARFVPMSPGQRNVVVAFGFTVILWLLPGVLAIAGLGESAFAKGYAAAVPESVAAIAGAILLFV